jgi:hypothetical protein
MTENRWLIALTVFAIAIGAFAGVAAQKEKAHAAEVAQAAKAAQSKKARDLASKAASATVAVSVTPTGGAVTTTVYTTTTGAATGGTTTTTTKTTVAKKKAVTTTKKSTTATTTVTATSRAAAVGDLVRYGTFGGASLQWRILSLDSKRAVLLSDEVLVAGPYQVDENAAAANDYATSSIRTWLSNTFVPTAFGAAASTNAVLGRSSASDVIAGDIAYLLTPSQLNRYLPEADDRVGGSSAWGTANPGFGNQTLASGSVYWWLAPEPGTPANNVAPVVQTNGAVNQLRYAAIGSDGVRPVVKLNVASLKLAAVAGQPGVYMASAK